MARSGIPLAMRMHRMSFPNCSKWDPGDRCSKSVVSSRNLAVPCLGLRCPTDGHLCLRDGGYWEPWSMAVVDLFGHGTVLLAWVLLVDYRSVLGVHSCLRILLYRMRSAWLLAISLVIPAYLVVCVRRIQGQEQKGMRPDPWPSGQMCARLSHKK
jgi:hypothetical protein